ncbi:MAG: protein-L-isoaspartate(D-aspartate) O-methyltransferase [Burkholderiaceae bacterium]|nr:MAG: protein-L-isoaspartate(D-aspartate) O-methyltransferase [Burkholderiaceae bacterium]
MTARFFGKAAAKPQPGMASERTRQRMVERIRQLGVRHPRVVHAMQAIPRHLFVDEGFASRAYEDTALPIAQGQTISQPYVVARMIELVLPAAQAASGMQGKVLEIGTGCGYQAAVLSQVFAEVYSIERIRALHEVARNNLRPLRIPNIRLAFGDGMLGLPQAAPFDAIIVAAAGLELPQVLLEQLQIGGKLIAPVGDADQYLLLVERTGPAQWQQTRLDAVRFVPLLAGTS